MLILERHFQQTAPSKKNVKKSFAWSKTKTVPFNWQPEIAKQWEIKNQNRFKGEL